MNGQIKYILHAALLILLGTIAILIFQKLSGEKIEATSETGWYDTSTSGNGIVLSKKSRQGKILFMDKCAACHSLFKDLTGPALFGFEERGSWKDRKNIYAWVRNPSSFMENDQYTRKLKDMYGAIIMTAFPDLTNEEIDTICEYINQSKKTRYQSIAVAED